MSFWSSWRTALRIARRETRRAKGRSAMVVLMIGAPVAALAMFAATFDMFTLTKLEQTERFMGAADARMSWPWHVPVTQAPNSDPSQLHYQPVPGYEEVFNDPTIDAPELKPGTQAELLAALPAGSHVVPYAQGQLEFETATGIGAIDSIWLDGSSPLTRGMLTLLEGRFPKAAGEIALSPPALRRVGGRLDGTVASADGEHTYRIVGIFEDPSDLGERALLAPRIDSGEMADTWLVDTPGPVTWAEIRRLNQFGIVVNSRELFLNPLPESELPPSLADAMASEQLTFTVLIAGLALLEIVLMAGPAFAVSARRRSRQLALVAANGGTPAQVRRIVLADGVVLGLIGAGAGIAAGVAGAVIGRPIVEQHLAGFRAGAYRFFPAALIAIAALAVVTGVLAALVPAIITARQDVVAALAGRRGARGSRKRWLALGITGAATGTAIVVYGTMQRSQTIMLAGMVVGELGLVLCTPALVGLVAQIGRMLPLAPRIALRDAARNRAAAAPAISAVMAAVAGSVALGLYIDSSAAQQRAGYRQNWPVGHIEVFLTEPTELPAGQEAPPVISAIEAAELLRSTVPVTGTYLLTRAGCATRAADHWCHVEPEVAPAKACPYLAEYRQSGILSPDKQRAARADPRCANLSAYYQPYIDDGSGVELVTGATGDDLAAAVAMLRSGGVVVTDEQLIDNGRARLKVTGHATAEAVRHEAPAHLLTTGTFEGLILPPTLAESYGLGPGGASLIAATSRMPTQAEMDALNARLARGHAYAWLEKGPPVEFDPRLLILIAAAALITVTAAGFGTGLAAADGRADLSTLAAVGASPRVRRVLSLSQSGVIAGLGSLLGAIAGMGAALAVLTALNHQWADVWPGPDPMPIRIPWLSLAIALLIVPAISVLGAGLLTRSRLPIERRL